MKEIDAQLLSPSSTTRPTFLGESPIWRSETDEILWVDIHGKTFFRRRFLKPGQVETTHEYPMPEMPGSFCLCDDGQLLFAFQDGLAFYDPDIGAKSLQRIAPFEPGLDTRMNDGRVDPMGRFVVGGYSFKGEPVTAVYRLDPTTMNVTKLLDNVACYNGTCFTQGNDDKNPSKDCAMFFTDSMALPRQIYRVGDYGTSGKVHRDAPFVTWTEEETNGTGKTCLPDGSVIDSAGNLWSCQFGRGRVVRLS